MSKPFVSYSSSTEVALPGFTQQPPGRTSRGPSGTGTGTAPVRESPGSVQDRIRELYPERVVPTAAQRIVEISVALIALLISIPVMVAIAIIIRLDSSGPALFRQRRVQQGGSTFGFFKFRTLFADAKQRFPHLYRYHYTPEELKEFRFKVPNDPRVTRVGRWLRSSTLDELPNFWNVLTGEMALVGPRPEIPEMLTYYTDEQLLKFTVRPGITGLAQSCGRGNLTFLDTVAMDCDYVRTRSWKLDIQILWKTLVAVLHRDGAF